MNWTDNAKYDDLRSVIDPGDVAGHKNAYINALQHWVLKDVLGTSRGKYVLDLGCGKGRFRDLFKQAEVCVGVDSCREMNPDVVTDVTDLSMFEDRIFDVVLSVILG